MDMYCLNRRELKTRAKAVLKFRYWQFLAVLMLYIVLPQFLTPSMNMESMSQRYLILTYGGTLGFSVLISIFIMSPLNMAISRYILKSSEDTETRFSVIWEVLRDNYFSLVKAGFWRDLFLMLWSIPYAVVTGAVAVMFYIKIAQNVSSGAVTDAELLSSISAQLPILTIALLLMIVFAVLVFYKAYAYQMVNYVMADHPETGWQEALAISKRMMKKKKLFALKLDLSFLGWYLLGAMAMGIGIYFVQPYVAATQAQFYMALKNE